MALRVALQAQLRRQTNMVSALHPSLVNIVHLCHV